MPRPTCLLVRALGFASASQPFPQVEPKIERKLDAVQQQTLAQDVPLAR